MKWKTRVTGLLGCKYPILQGAYAGFGDWEFAAAVANTGAHGLITASTCPTPEKLREDIKKCKAATGGTFGVNFTLTGSLPYAEMVEVCIDEGVPVETAAYKPDALAPRLREAGIPWIHKAARVKDAVKVESMGADAVIVVGLEGTGFKSAEQMPTMITAQWALRELKIPFIAAGGIGDARGLLGALSMGADAVMMGTAFMATKECSVRDTAKDAIVEVGYDNLEHRHQVLATANPKDLEEVMKLRDKMPLDKWLSMLERVNLNDPNWRDPDAPSVQSSLDSKLRMVSLAAGVVDEIPTVKEFIDGIIKQAEEIAGKWEFNK
jgi:NAD(P)H-dependent flavin oxidoreductase YrpB (nitropropane dioxygenase family)